MALSCLTRLHGRGNQYLSHLTPDELSRLTPDEIKAQIQQAHQRNINTHQNTLFNTTRQRQHLSSLTGSKTENFHYLQDNIIRRKGNAGKYTTVEDHAVMIYGKAQKHLTGAFEKVQKWGGLIKHKQMLSQITKHLYHGQGSQEVATIVDGMNKTLKEINTEAQSRGITNIITDLKDLSATSPKIQNYTVDEFVSFAKPLVQETEAELRALKAKIDDGTAENYVLHYNSANDAIKFQEQYGTDSFTSLLKYTEDLARKTAGAEVFGTRNNLEALIKKADLHEKKRSRLLSLYDMATNNIKVEKLVQSKKTLENISGSARSIVTASKLGFAAVSSLLDLGTMKTIASFNNIPTFKMYTKMIKNLVNSNDRRALQQMGFQIEAVQTVFSNANRFTQHDVSGNVANMFANVATGVLKSSGLFRLSEAMKVAYKQSHLATFRNLADYSFNDLPKQFGDNIRRHGFTETDWNIIRQMDRRQLMLDPTKITNETTKAKVYKIINHEGDMAVTTPGVESKYFTSGFGAEQGTLGAESAKFISQFKGTMIQQLLGVVWRSAEELGKGKLGIATNYMFFSLLMGAATVQVKEALNNRTPMDTTSNEFIGRTIQQAGTIPIVSDLLAQVVNPSYFDQSFQEMMFSSATTGVLLDLSNTTKNAISHIGDKDEDKYNRKLADQLMGLAPGSNIWYVRALFNSFVKYNIDYAIDPKGLRKKMRREQKKMRKLNQNYIMG